MKPPKTKIKEGLFQYISVEIKNNNFSNHLQNKNDPLKPAKSKNKKMCSNELMLKAKKECSNQMGH